MKQLMNIKNKIIVDGFWGLGKTSVIKKLEQEFDYLIINEPNHLRSNDLIKDIDINNWYIKEHKKNQDLFFSSDKNVVMERSIISSIAYLYAIEEMDTDEFTFAQKVFSQFNETYLNSKAIIVVLCAPQNQLSNIIHDIQDREIKSRSKMHNFSQRYEEFYCTILPFQYNIYPLYINIFNEADGRKSTSEIIDLILNKE